MLPPPKQLLAVSRIQHTGAPNEIRLSLVRPLRSDFSGVRPSSSRISPRNSSFVFVCGAAYTRVTAGCQSDLGSKIVDRPVRRAGRGNGKLVPQGAVPSPRPSPPKSGERERRTLDRRSSGVARSIGNLGRYFPENADYSGSDSGTIHRRTTHAYDVCLDHASSRNRLPSLERPGSGREGQRDDAEGEGHLREVRSGRRHQVRLP